MSIPWLRIIGGLLGLGEVVRTVRGRSEGEREQSALVRGVRTLGGIEARLAGAVVAALKEAFDRDHERLELERSQIEAQQRRAERALQLELLRQAGDREMGRLRLLTGVALVSWLSTLLLARGAATFWPRLAFGLGWVLLLAALATGLIAQSRVARAAARLDDGPLLDDVVQAGSLAAAAPWLIVGGLAAIGAAVLLA